MVVGNTKTIPMMPTHREVLLMYWGGGEGRGRQAYNREVLLNVISTFSATLIGIKDGFMFGNI